MNVVCHNAFRLSNTENEERSVVQEFEENAGFDGVIGTIDGCQIQIQAPQTSDKSLYFDRKKRCLTLLQGLCDTNCFFINIDKWWPHSVHDARAFSTSDVYPLCQQICGN